MSSSHEFARMPFCYYRRSKEYWHNKHCLEGMGCWNVCCKVLRFIINLKKQYALCEWRLNSDESCEDTRDRVIRRKLAAAESFARKFFEIFVYVPIHDIHLYCLLSRITRACYIWLSKNFDFEKVGCFVRKNPRSNIPRTQIYPARVILKYTPQPLNWPVIKAENLHT